MGLSEQVGCRDNAVMGRYNGVICRYKPVICRYKCGWKCYNITLYNTRSARRDFRNSLLSNDLRRYFTREKPKKALYFASFELAIRGERGGKAANGETSAACRASYWGEYFRHFTRLQFIRELPQSVAGGGV